MPVYFELSWSILSTIGLANVLFGILVVGITSLSPISTVPIVTSAAGAIANGLCYYAFYDESNPKVNQAVASGFADLMWMVRDLLPPSPSVLGDNSRKLTLRMFRFKKLASHFTATLYLVESCGTSSGTSLQAFSGL